MNPKVVLSLHALLTADSLPPLVRESRVVSLPVGFLTPLPSLRSEARSGDDKRSEEEGKVAEDLGTYHVGTSVVSATLLLVCALPFPIPFVSQPFLHPVPAPCGRSLLLSFPPVGRSPEDGGG